MAKPSAKRRPAKLHQDAAIFDRVVSILEEARQHVARTVNSAMVIAYWLIGREIVVEEQKGKKRAEHGKSLITDLSRRVTAKYGRGYSVTSLKYFRTFYLTYASRSLQIGRPMGDLLRLPMISLRVK